MAGNKYTHRKGRARGWPERSEKQKALSSQDTLYIVDIYETVSSFEFLKINALLIHHEGLKRCFQAQAMLFACDREKISLFAYLNQLLTRSPGSLAP